MHRLLFFSLIFSVVLNAENAGPHSKLKAHIRDKEIQNYPKNQIEENSLTFSNNEMLQDQEKNSPFLMDNFIQSSGTSGFLEHQILESENDLLIFGHPLGIGFGVRFCKNRLNYELDLSLSPFFAAASMNIMMYFSETSKWYTGVGVGLFSNRYSSEFLPYFPITIGYWGKDFFTDFGFDLHPVMFFFPPIPTLRVGYHF